MTVLVGSEGLHLQLPCRKQPAKPQRTSHISARTSAPVQCKKNLAAVRPSLLQQRKEILSALYPLPAEALAVRRPSLDLARTICVRLNLPRLPHGVEWYRLLLHLRSHPWLPLSSLLLEATGANGTTYCKRCRAWPTPPAMQSKLRRVGRMSQSCKDAALILRKLPYIKLDLACSSQQHPSKHHWRTIQLAYALKPRAWTSPAHQYINTVRIGWGIAMFRSALNRWSIYLASSKRRDRGCIGRCSLSKMLPLEPHTHNRSLQVRRFKMGRRPYHLAGTMARVLDLHACGLNTNQCIRNEALHDLDTAWPEVQREHPS